jgi:hypothetical protein
MKTEVAIANTPRVKLRKKHEAMTLDTYMDMLTYQRCAWSQGESDFINRYLGGYPQDSFGNVRIEVDPTNTSTLFSCHTDSIHPPKGLRQHLFIDPHLGQVFKHDGWALGADDAIGIWLMLHMIQQEVPGVYVFHRAEERGGHGSAWIKKEDPTFLTQFERAIAFDRKGTTSVITSQRGGVCASAKFGQALADALGNGYKIDTGGVFTDTANYISMIPECTNLSAGYNKEHTSDETQDIAHAELLYGLVTKLQWEKLPTLREPKEPPAKPAYVASKQPRYGHNTTYKSNVVPHQKPAGKPDAVVVGLPGKYQGQKGTWVGHKFYPKGQEPTVTDKSLDRVAVEVIESNKTPIRLPGTPLPGAPLKEPTADKVDPLAKRSKIPENFKVRFFDEEDAFNQVQDDPMLAAAMLYAAYKATEAELHEFTKGLMDDPMTLPH